MDLLVGGFRYCLFLNIFALCPGEYGTYLVEKGIPINTLLSLWNFSCEPLFVESVDDMPGVSWACRNLTRVKRRLRAASEAANHGGGDCQWRKSITDKEFLTLIRFTMCNVSHSLSSTMDQLVNQPFINIDRWTNWSNQAGDRSIRLAIKQPFMVDPLTMNQQTINPRKTIYNQPSVFQIISPLTTDN